jgi:hypothetical protein
MAALIDLSRLSAAEAVVPPRSRSTVLDTASLLSRFGLASHLVAHWAPDRAGRPVCVWREDIVPHRPSVARDLRRPHEGAS